MRGFSLFVSNELICSFVLLLIVACFLLLRPVRRETAADVGYFLTSLFQRDASRRGKSCSSHI